GSGVRGHSDGSATEARLSQPTMCLVDRSGRTFVADAGNHRIRVVSDDGKTIVTLAGSGLAGQSDVGMGKGSEAKFKFVSAIAEDEAGHVVVADTQNN